jgi:hypothetical protein
MAKEICQGRLGPAVDDRRSRWAATASRVSSATRSALITAPAIAPALAEARTCAVGLVTFPATQTPGTAVRPVASDSTYSPRPCGSSVVSSPRSTGVDRQPAVVPSNGHPAPSKG